MCQARFVGIIIIIFLSSTLSRYSAVSAPLILVLWSVPLNRLKVILNYRKYDTIILYGPPVPLLYESLSEILSEFPLQKLDIYVQQS